MTTELKQLDTAAPKEIETTLYPKILDILFENRRYIKNIFLNINGLYDIAHIGVTIIDPASEIVVFSSTPNIEYNLIHQNLWKNDLCFSPRQHNNNRLSWWDTQFDEIEKIKLKNNKFTVGMTITRQVNDFCLLFSFATRSKKKDLREYYESNIFGLIDVGDYFYKSIMSIYSSISVKYTPPKLDNLMSKASVISSRSYLKLVVSNSE
ncbi:MAG: hypothetical protein A3E88_07495 [Legionellales bacterium RIFCSPHIGHO2_12_FULL_35_11]|nr:MAG: hypothetical protein A3E88_07495 [Legionellales bacterium RIFCSPHIGHO2_12_FULL_35_11]